MIKWLFTFFISFFCFSANAASLILLTGFEPFGGSAANSSWEAIKNLNGKQIGQSKIVVARLPVVWDEASNQLRASVIANQPDFIISFGEASLFPPRFEMIARNERKYYYDNNNQLPKTEYISKDGPNNLSTMLPVIAIQSLLQAEHIPFVVSKDAGGYLCNEVFYTLMYQSGSINNPPRGFIHLPALNTAFTNNQGKQVMFDQGKLQHIVELIVQVIAENRHYHSI